MGNLTENFDKEEFSCPCCGFNNIDERLVHRLQVIRDIVAESIKINSACRCVKHNDEVGGETGSFHLLGLAVDWTLGDIHKLRRLCENLIGNWSGGFHYYAEKNFCHTDIAKRRRW